ncbi:hypothetical protein [Devosia sp.]
MPLYLPAHAPDVAAAESPQQSLFAEADFGVGADDLAFDTDPDDDFY